MLKKNFNQHVKSENPKNPYIWLILKNLILYIIGPECPGDGVGH
jgi:hypothetical protein